MKVYDDLVSVVIPTYNHAAFLKRAIQSVIEQTHQNWEILVVDNHSEDDTDDIVREFDNEKIRLLKVHNHGVIAASRNLGIRESKGEYVAFLDSDDWWGGNKLKKSLDFMNSGNDVVYHDLWIVYDQAEESKNTHKSRSLKQPVFETLLTEGNCIPNSSVVIRRNLLIEAGLLDESREVIASEDYDLWIRVSLLTEKFLRIPEVLGYYWYGGANISKTKDLSIAGSYILKKHRSVLSDKVYLKATGYLCYVKAIYLISDKRFTEARKFLYKSLMEGNIAIKSKSIYRIFNLQR